MKVRQSAKAMPKDNLPSFDNPPLIETVIGVQFDQLPNLTSAHLGWYWREFLDRSWVRTFEATPIADQFEAFGEQARRFPSPSLSAVLTSIPSPRIQFVNEADDRVLQIQNTRFLYNWRKREASYPRFNDLFSQFTASLARFREFLRAASIGDITVNQWELTYINHIEKGEAWKTPEDWHKLLPGLFTAPRKTSGTRLERDSGEAVFEIMPERGRLHVQASGAKSQENGNEVLALYLTARGPIVPSNPTVNLESGLELGHRVLIETFAGIASELAQKLWRRNQS
jgi:uncharacterized protein (TIGR04255 family)